MQKLNDLPGSPAWEVGELELEAKHLGPTAWGPTRTVSCLLKSSLPP